MVEISLLPCPNDHHPGNDWIECHDDRMSLGGVFFKVKENDKVD